VEKSKVAKMKYKDVSPKEATTDGRYVVQLLLHKC
jgi:hypothetical protein